MKELLRCIKKVGARFRRFMHVLQHVSTEEHQISNSSSIRKEWLKEILQETAGDLDDKTAAGTILLTLFTVSRFICIRFEVKLDMPSTQYDKYR